MSSGPSGPMFESGLEKFLDFFHHLPLIICFIIISQMSGGVSMCKQPVFELNHFIEF